MYTDILCKLCVALEDSLKILPKVDKRKLIILITIFITSSGI